MAGIVFLTIQLALGYQVEIKSNLAEFKKKCWDSDLLPIEKRSEMIIQLAFLSCGKDSIDSETLSSLSISEDFSSIHLNSPTLKKSFYDFFTLFPENFLKTLEENLKSSENLENIENSLPKNLKSFCLNSLSDWETVLHSDHGSPNEKLNKKEKHGIYLTISWIYLIPTAIFVGRYYKTASWWIFLHIPLGLISVGLIYNAYEVISEGEGHPYTKYKPEKFLHSRLGQALMSLITTSAFSGLCFSCFKLFTTRTSLVLVLVRFHHFLSYSILVAAVYNCYLGWTFVDSGYKYLFYFGVGFWVIVFGGFEIRMRFFNNKEKNKLKKTSHLDVLKNVGKHNYLVFFDEFVLDVNHFYKTHPGGSYMIAETIGEDMGKYMVGCSSYSADFNPYEHTKIGIAMIKDLAINIITYPSGYFESGPDNYNSNSFKLVSKVEIAKDTFLFCFKNEDLELSKTCSKAQWLGKHFSVTLPDDPEGTIRYYSALFVNPIHWKNQLKHGHSDDDSVGQVKFIIKIYPGGKVTSSLSKLKESETVLLRGPYGPGLAISDLTGNYLALAGGTGLVPFLDLVYLQCTQPSPNFKLTIFAFFRDKESAFTSDILQEIQSSNPNWLSFNLITTGSRSQDLQNSILQKSQSSDLTWICGPSGFNRSYHDLLTKNQVPSNKLILM